ncbi:MAG: hypothetical protein ACTSVV_09315 [Promethearchaeota archaeon]
MLNSTKLKELIFERGITITEDNETHKKITKKSFIITTIYSILYGWYEHFIVYNNFRLLDITGEIGNWAMMYLGVLILVAIVSKFRIEQMVMGLFYMTLLEDVFSHSGNIITYGTFPFPAGDWYDEYIASFRVLGGLGQPIPIWPYVPIFYVFGFPIVFFYYLCAYFKDSKFSRIFAWFVGPFYLSILFGALGGDFQAIIILITLPIISYLYALFIFANNNWKFILD